jgi:hypothetical protein
MCKKSILNLMVLLFSMVYLGVIQATDTQNHSLTTKIEKTEASKAKDNVILIQFAGSGSIEKDKSDPSLYKITLIRVTPYLNYVADRPGRTVGKISLEKYLKLWTVQGQNSFDNSPPNAIIHSHAGSAGENGTENFALEISKPQYDETTDTLVYQGRRLSGQGADLPDKANFEHMTIIIDDVCIGCWD